MWSFVSSLLYKHSLRGLNIYRCMLPCLTLYIIKYYTPTERVHSLQMFNKGWKPDEGTMSYQNGFHIWGRFYIAFIERAQSVPSMWIRPRYVLINAVSRYSGIILSSELRKKREQTVRPRSCLEIEQVDFRFYTLPGTYVCGSILAVIEIELYVYTNLNTLPSFSSVWLLPLPAVFFEQGS